MSAQCAPSGAAPESRPSSPRAKTTTTPSAVLMVDADDPDEADEKGFQNDQHLKPLETGLLAWSQVLAGALGNCMSWGNPATFGVYQLHYQETLHLPSSQISWIGSIQVFLTFLLCAVAGRLADAGHTRATVCTGTLLSVLGILATSFATEYWHIFLAQGVCTGLGLGLLFMPCVSVISSYFYRRRPFALALAATGSGFGSVAFPALVQYLTPRIGFPWAVRCHALLALLIAGSECLLLRPRLAGRKKGPLFEWDAFMEPTYFLFAVGTFLFFWVLYFGYFYVRHPFPSFGFPRLHLPDQRLRPQRHRLRHHLIRPAAHHYQRHGYPRASYRRLDRQ
jgi:MFS family permease